MSSAGNSVVPPPRYMTPIITGLYKFRSCFIFSLFIPPFPLFPLAPSLMFWCAFGYVMTFLKYSVTELLYVCDLTLYEWYCVIALILVLILFS